MRIFYHSTILKTITNELGTTKLTINDGIKNLFNGKLFEKRSILSHNDLNALKTYNAEIERGVSPMTAYYRTMQDASDVLVNMAQAAGNTTIDLTQIHKVSKAGQLAMQGLAMAGNMLATKEIVNNTKALQELKKALASY